ncbi:hypothetical protein JW921_08650 [Candidatus Fermentibacterales bacterium]|nr:hypothetical protein [Candidatus Fermentibacterales bacterium]
MSRQCTAVCGAGLPSTLLLLRVRSVVVPLPWLLLWVLALALLPLCWLVGFLGRGIVDPRVAGLLSQWHHVVLLLAAMRGTEVSVRSRESRSGAPDVYLKWI